MRTLPSLVFAMLLVASNAHADSSADKQAIEELLHTFLANVEERATHQRFWAEDLIYTSSAGERFGKQQILAGFDNEAAAPNGPRYSAESITVRVTGDIAVLTFQLKAEQTGEAPSYYFNTGVFRRTDAAWQAFTWQATRVP